MLSLTSSYIAWPMWQSAPSASLKWNTNEKSGWHTWLRYHSEGPRQAGEMGQRHLLKVMKCQALSWGRNNPMHQDKLGANWLENSFAEKHLCFLVVTKMNRSQQHALTALAESAMSSPGLPQARQTWIYWTGSSEGPQTWLRDWSTCRKRGKLRLLWQFSLGKEGSGVPINVYKYLMRGVKKMEPEPSHWGWATK